eukprot:GHVR01023292.1.p3 GENE.GHVR01023292.1~~GHVR01023292.1.p3  ORF type:complete len:143 (-),score=55.64 GHVR01023292.1:670-1098(-)
MLSLNFISHSDWIQNQHLQHYVSVCHICVYLQVELAIIPTRVCVCLLHFFVECNLSDTHTYTHTHTPDYATDTFLFGSCALHTHSDPDTHTHTHMDMQTDTNTHTHTHSHNPQIVIESHNEYLEWNKSEIIAILTSQKETRP